MNAGGKTPDAQSGRVPDLFSTACGGIPLRVVVVSRPDFPVPSKCPPLPLHLKTTTRKSAT